MSDDEEEIPEKVEENKDGSSIADRPSSRLQEEDPRRKEQVDEDHRRPSKIERRSEERSRDRDRKPKKRRRRSRDDSDSGGSEDRDRNKKVSSKRDRRTDRSGTSSPVPVVEKVVKKDFRSLVLGSPIPVLGLQFVQEILPESCRIFNDQEPYYDCSLCDVRRLASGNMAQHIQGFKHTQNYLKRQYGLNMTDRQATQTQVSLISKKEPSTEDRLNSMKTIYGKRKTKLESFFKEINGLIFLV